MIATAPARQSPLAATAPDTIELVRIQIGETGFALPLAAIATILSPSAMTSAEYGSVWAGSVPSRSGEIPIASGRSIFDIDGHASNQQRLLILRGAPATGLLVDAIHGTSTIPTADIAWLSPLFGPVERLLVQSVAWGQDGALDLVIDVPALRRHLHGPSDNPSNATDAIASLFANPPAGDRLEIQLDDSATRWLLPIDYVRHISDPRPPAHLPRTSESILGLLAWRREPIPLIDTACALGLQPSDPATLIVIGPESQPDEALFALTIANVAGVAAADSTSALLDLGEVVRRLG
jgi:chemotaxis signal transduction protein